MRRHIRNRRMKMRNITLSGTVANFGQVDRARTTGEGERNDAFCIRFLNVSMDRKDEETGYTKHETIKVLANGYMAERLSKFAPMEKVYITGKLEKEADYVTEERTLPGQWIVRIDFIDNWPEAENATSNTTTSAPAPQTAKPAAKKPTAKRKPTIKTRTA